jgi:hypothetical protein
MLLHTMSIRSGNSNSTSFGLCIVVENLGKKDDRILNHNIISNEFCLGLIQLDPVDGIVTSVCRTLPAQVSYSKNNVITYT